jgi:hypothetical protein
MSRVVWILLFFAALQVGRAAVSQNVNYIDLQQYSEFKSDPPFCNRILMATVLRHLGNNHVVVRVYKLMFRKTVSDPLNLVVEGVDCACLLLLLPVTVGLRREFGPREDSSWLAPLVMVLVVTVTFVVRYEQNFTMPYDFLSILFFNLGMFAVLKRQGWLLLLILAVAVPNRETAVFLVPVWFWMEWSENRKLSAVGYSVAGMAVYLLWRSWIARMLHSPAQPYVFPFGTNLMSALLPIHWPQLMSTLGFLAIPIWMMRDLVTDLKLKAVWVSLVVFVAAALTVGIWRETRIFGELSVMVGITFAMQLEAITRREATVGSQPLSKERH